MGNAYLALLCIKGGWRPSFSGSKLIYRFGAGKSRCVAICAGYESSERNDTWPLRTR